MNNLFQSSALLIYDNEMWGNIKVLLFLLYVNDIFQSLSEAGSYLYADDTCFLYQQKEVKIENVLNKEFLFLCQWFRDNKL